MFGRCGVTFVYDACVVWLQVFESDEEGLVSAVMPSKLVATTVKIVPVIDEEGSDTISVEDVSLFACFEEEFTSVTTTTRGTATTEKTTTKFTSAGTTVTTVVATTTPTATTGMFS